MKTDKTSTNTGTSRAVTQGPTSLMEKGSHSTNQMNRKSASRVPANPIHSSTKDHLFSSEKKTDPNTLDFSPAPTSGEKSNPMNPIAHRPNRVDSCIHKQTKDVATIEGHSSSNISNPITNVGTEPLASQCLQDDELANDATNNMVHDSQNISKPLHAAVGATSLFGKDVDENKIAISSTSTDKGNYLFLPEEEMDTAAAAAKSVPKASAVNETGRSTKEAVKEVSTYFLKLHCLPDSAIA